MPIKRRTKPNTQTPRAGNGQGGNTNNLKHGAFSRIQLKKLDRRTREGKTLIAARGALTSAMGGQPSPLWCEEIEGRCNSPDLRTNSVRIDRPRPAAFAYKGSVTLSPKMSRRTTASGPGADIQFWALRKELSVTRQAVVGPSALRACGYPSRR